MGCGSTKWLWRIPHSHYELTFRGLMVIIHLHTLNATRNVLITFNTLGWVMERHLVYINNFSRHNRIRTTTNHNFHDFGGLKKIFNSIRLWYG